MNPKQIVERDLEVPKTHQIKMIENSHHKDKAVLAQKIDLMNLQLTEARNREKNLKISYFELLEKYHQDSHAEKDSTSVVLLNILKKHLLLDSDKSSLPSTIMQAFEKEKAACFEAFKDPPTTHNLASEVDKDESLLAFIENRKASKDLSEISKEHTLRSSRSVADLKVKEVMRRGSNAVVAKYFDKKTSDSLFGTQERFETQANELNTFKKSHQSSLSRIHPLCSRKHLLKQSTEEVKETRYNTFQNDSSFTPCRNLFGDSLQHTTSNLKPYTSSVDKETTGQTGCVASKLTSSKRNQATSSVSFRNLLSPKVFQTGSSVDKDNPDLKRSADPETKSRPQTSTLQVKPSLVGNAFSLRSSQNTSKLSAFVQREMAKRDSQREAQTKPSSPVRMPRRGSKDCLKGAKISSKLNSANSLKVPHINIHLTPNDRDVEAIEIDASVPDKCLIKFQRAATIQETSPEAGPFGKPAKNMRGQPRDYLLNLDNHDLRRGSRGSKIFESNASLAADMNTSRVLRVRDTNSSAVPLQVYSQRRDTLSALRKTQSKGLLAHYDSAISKGEVKQRKESLADIESTQRQLTQELHKITSIYQSHKHL